jgi:putative redox protein
VTEPKPPVIAELVWSNELLFTANSRTISLEMDGHSTAGPSPVQMLVMSFAGCMAMDVVDILRRGRHPVTAFRATATALRAPDHPHRVTSVDVQFDIRGAVPEPAVERAIELSRDKYCSVWHSMRQDIALTTSFVIQP